MAVRWYQLAVNAHDLPSLARFWCQVLDWRVVFESEEEVVIASAPDALPGICFVPVSERKTAQNRLHIDLTPDGQAAEASEARWGSPRPKAGGGCSRSGRAEPTSARARA